MIKVIAKLLYCYIVKKAGFTLIELLIVVAVVGVLSAGVVTSINIVSKINSANLAKAETFDASIQNNLSIDLVREWTFSGNTNDTSGYGNNGTPIGGAAPAPDRRGQDSKAYSFDGTDDYIDAGNGASLQITGSLTLEAWIKKTQSSEAGGIVNRATCCWNGYFLDTGSDKIHMLIGNGGTAEFFGNTTFSLNEWHHIVGVYDSVGLTLKVYLDGKLDGSVNTTIGSLTLGLWNASIGARNSLNGALFPGLIDDVRIYKQALLSSQVQQLYAQGLKGHRLAKQVDR